MPWLQCGFCTPGLLLSTLHLLSRNSKPTEQQIRKAIAGTLAVAPIPKHLKAIRMAAGEMEKR